MGGARADRPDRLGGGHFGLGAIRGRPPRRRLPDFPDPQRRSGRLRRALQRDAHCRAWSFSYPRTAYALATCWLKNKLPPPVADKCCVSGVRGRADRAAARPARYSMDRFGSDYRSVDVATDPAGAGSSSACQGDNRCRAWTYVRPAISAPSARCYLEFEDYAAPPRALLYFRCESGSAMGGAMSPRQRRLPAMRIDR